MILATLPLSLSVGQVRLHACEVAEQLSIPRVLIPRYPGVMCAFGALVADIVS